MIRAMSLLYLARRNVSPPPRGEGSGVGDSAEQRLIWIRLFVQRLP